MSAGENLADLADRCDVKLGDLFNANPAFRTVEIPAGTEVKIPGGDGRSVLGRAGDALRDAGREVEDAATRAGKSVSDYLSDNPDLNRDILEWGERLGLPGVKASPQTGADLSLSRQSGLPGDEITLRATGLRGGAEAVIGLDGRNSEYRVIERSKTSSAGDLQITLKIPEWAQGERALTFVVETDRVRITSQPFNVEQP